MSLGQSQRFRQPFCIPQPMVPPQMNHPPPIKHQPMIHPLMKGTSQGGSHPQQHHQQHQILPGFPTHPYHPGYGNPFNHPVYHPNYHMVSMVPNVSTYVVYRCCWRWMKTFSCVLFPYLFSQRLWIQWCFSIHICSCVAVKMLNLVL